MKRTVLRCIPADASRRERTDILDMLLFAYLRERGLILVRYEEPGEDVETSHGRSYWSSGKVTFGLEPEGTP